MGQYWIPVNLDKKEYINPHKLGTGLKLWEQLVNHPSTGGALVILLANMKEKRGGGDFEEHPAVGRWAGDKVVLIGEYAEENDLEGFDAREISKHIHGEDNGEYKDISDMVCECIEKELNGKFEGEGWRTFNRKD